MALFQCQSRTVFISVFIRVPTWFLVLISVLPATAFSVQLRVASTGGLMQQPASHYYHAVYGAQVNLNSDSEAFCSRFSYIERPEFSDQGFADKDYGGFAQIGARAKSYKLGRSQHGIYAYIGAGQMAGYVRVEKDHTTVGEARERRFRLSGLTASADYVIALASFDLALGHQSFVGLSDRDQTNSMVAWPYNFFTLSVGYRW